MGEGTGCTAMDQVFHVDCFVCMTCSTKLRGKPFYAVEKKAYCEPCYIVSNFCPFKSTCLLTIKLTLVSYVARGAGTLVLYCSSVAECPYTFPSSNYISSHQSLTRCQAHHTQLRFLSFVFGHSVKLSFVIPFPENTVIFSSYTAVNER